MAVGSFSLSVFQVTHPTLPTRKTMTHPWDWHMYLHENHILRLKILKTTIHVGKYTSPMDGMGHTLSTKKPARHRNSVLRIFFSGTLSERSATRQVIGSSGIFFPKARPLPSCFQPVDWVLVINKNPRLGHNSNQTSVTVEVPVGLAWRCIPSFAEFRHSPWLSGNRSCNSIKSCKKAVSNRFEQVYRLVNHCFLLSGFSLFHWIIAQHVYQTKTAAWNVERTFSASGTCRWIYSKSTQETVSKSLDMYAVRGWNATQLNTDSFISHYFWIPSWTNQWV